MSTDFLYSTKLATREELNFLLFDVLARKKLTGRNEIGTLCKERSFNFAYAFENTLSFLSEISIISIQEDNIYRNPAIDFMPLTTDDELSTLLLQNMCGYLESTGVLKKIFNEHTLMHEADVVVINTNALPAAFSFIKIFLLNMKIAEAEDELSGELLITGPFKKIFMDSILTKVSDKHVPDKAPSKKIKLFVSYASADEEYKIQLRKHLQPLIDSGYIDYWDGYLILPGEDWHEEIKKNLEQAKVILFLLSSDSISSQYIKEVEFARAMERHNKREVKIISILLRDVDVESSPFGRFQMLPTKKKAIASWNDKDEAYVNIINGIKEILKEKI